MTKAELTERTDNALASGKESLQLWWDLTPKGVQKQLVKNETVKRTLDIYGVQYDE